MEVVILAGGLGTRLRSVVSEVPKCMAPVGGKPFLWYLLEQLRHYPVERVILSVGYLRDAVFAWVDAHRAEYPFDLCFAVEEEPLGTGGGIRLASAMADGPEVVVLNGDTFFDADLNALLEARRKSGAAITLGLKPMSDFDRYGTVVLDDAGKVLGFREKAPCAQGLVNGGAYAIDLESEVLEGHGKKFSFEKDVLELQCADGGLYGIVQDGFFIDIGIPADYEEACAKPWLLQHRASLADTLQSLHGYDTLLLDRDGVINRMLPGDYVKTWDEFEWLPGAMGALKLAASLFPRIYIVTNQRGVGRGVMSSEALRLVHSRMLEEVSAAGGRIDGIYVCTAVDDDDPWRKPNRGMFDRILADHPEVLPERTVMIGDTVSDMLFARNCGIRGVLVENNY